MNDSNPVGSANDASSSSERAQIAAENVIHSGGDVTEEDIAEGGFVGSMPGSGMGGLGDPALGASTRGDASGAFGTRVGGITGNTGVTGMDVNSTDAGPTDITGGGTASGLGGTSGGGTA
jgi:hypothetical protein